MSKSSRILFVLTLNLLLFVTMFYSMLPVQAADFTVTNTNASGTGSLRQAIADALASGGADVITFDPSLNGQTIALTDTLYIADELTIDASALADSVIVSGNEITRVFYLDSSAIVTMTHLNIVDGRTPTGAGMCSIYCGGGIFVDFFAQLTLQDSLVTENFANSGGGIASSFGANVVIDHSRIISNEALYEGGGLRLDADTMIRNSAVLSNTSNGGPGGGFYTTNTTAIQVISSTIAYNTAVGSDGGGIYGTSIESLLIRDSTLAFNQGDKGGALALDSSFFTLRSAEISNSTISGNAATGGGGAVYATGIFSGSLMLTLTQNSLVGNSSGIEIAPDPSVVITPTVNNTLIVNSTGDNCVGVTGNSSDLSDDDTCTSFLEGNARLAPLADNGGPTWTHLPTTGSDAMGNGDVTICQSAPINGRDQRGVVREVDACDIGATEVPDTSFIPEIEIDINPPLQVVATGESASFTVTVQNSGNVTMTNLAVSESPAISCNYASGVLGDLPIDANTSYTCALVVTSDTVNSLVAAGQALIDNIATGPFVSDTVSAQVLVASLTMTKTAYVDGYREVTGPGVFNPSDCALASNITVPVSSTVKYCYTITNTGSYTLPIHTLIDDQFAGAILADYPFALGPGQSVTSVAAGEIPTQTLVITTTNVATWTAAVPILDGALPANPVVITASATVNISGIAQDQDGDGYLDNFEGSGDLDDDGIPNYLDDTDGRPPVDVDVKILIPFAAK